MAIDKIGKFTVLGTLGSGAHSNILHIRRAEDEKEYALKMVPIEEKEDLKYLEQAKHEYRVGQTLNHPNLVKVYAFETEGGWFSGPKKAKLLLEYVPGKTMDKVPLLRMAKLLRVLERVADGLHARFLTRLRGLAHFRGLSGDLSLRRLDAGGERGLHLRLHIRLRGGLQFLDACTDIASIGCVPAPAQVSLQVDKCGPEAFEFLVEKSTVAQFFRGLRQHQQHAMHDGERLVPLGSLAINVLEIAQQAGNHLPRRGRLQEGLQR